MSTYGYYRFPTIHGDRIVFVADDDLWTVSAEGGAARRLTAGHGSMSRPMLAPDGQTLYFVSQDGGEPDLYRMDAQGGPMERLTYSGGIRRVAGFHPDGRVVVSTGVKSPVRGVPELFFVGPGGALEALRLGPASSIAWGPGGAVAIGRNAGDSATWKRYRGGTAGEIWLDTDGSGEYRRLEWPGGNPGAPFFVRDRLYFVSDYEGIANLYSVDRAGENLRRHTDADRYYVRNASADHQRIVYHMGGDLYVFDPALNEGHVVPVVLNGQRPRRQFRLVDAAPFLTDYAPHPSRAELAITSRGQTVSLSPFDGPVIRRSPGSGVRTRLTSWLDEQDLVAVYEHDHEERVVRLRPGSEPVPLADRDLGLAAELVPSPAKTHVALATQRLELFVIDVASGEVRLLDHSNFGFRVGVDAWKEGIRGLSWSHDGRYLAYAIPNSPDTTAIRVAEVESGTVHTVTEPLLEDMSPAFDPEGRYLFFLGKRDFTPVLDQFAFDMSFPRGIRPYLIPLRQDTPSPFLGGEADEAPPPKTADAAGDKSDHAEAPEAPARKLAIDFPGMAERIIPLPVGAGRLDSLSAIAGKVLWVERPLGVEDPEGEGREPGTLVAFDLKTRKTEALARGVLDYRISEDGKTALIRQRRHLRRAAAGEKVDESKGDRPGRDTGIIDLQRVTLPIDPTLEWPQMFREAWRLMREHYWASDMASVDWQAMYDRYAPLVERVGSRAEFSDLLWEMQGELGTSHAYEFGGDYPPSPPWPRGGLGADFTWSVEHGAFVVDNIVHGDRSVDGEDSPLRLPGVNVAAGDLLRAIDGEAVTLTNPPDRLLLAKRGREVALLVERPGEEARTVVVKTLSNETAPRYRAWVLHNRNTVWEKTDGRVGYLHIPNMVSEGFAEFHRLYLSEVGRRDALIVDVRSNGGGQLSPLFLEKLARRRIGWTYPRYGQPVAYPYQAPAGPLVVITNEYAGSDGDIFTHSFKLMGLGPVVGHRTWGGVVGINPELKLVDGSIVTQPEFAVTFHDVGLGVENYGTDPTIPIDNRPQDYAAGRDAQLERAIAEALTLLETTPPLSPPPKPSLMLKPGALPPRS